MNEAQQMHDHLVNAILPIIPRTVYQDRRRLNTLVWAIVGLCLTQTVHFSAWAEVISNPDDHSTFSLGNRLEKDTVINRI